MVGRRHRASDQAHRRRAPLDFRHHRRLSLCSGIENRLSPDEIEALIHGLLRAYRASLPHDRRLLLDRFELIEVTRKVVGVGSVGTRAWIVLFQGRDSEDPLFLQVKEASSSVLEDHLPKSAYRQPGERVVQGQRLMQAASDIFLGWKKGVDADLFYYWRQLRDMKGSAEIGQLRPDAMAFYGGVCGWTLARARGTTTPGRTRASSSRDQPVHLVPTIRRQSRVVRPLAIL